MHEFSFSDVALPDRHVVLQLPLRDFCIGHRLILLRQRNPLLWQPETDFNALSFSEQVSWLTEAVYVCAQSFAHRQELEKAPTRWLLWRNARLVKKWHRLHRHYTEADWMLAVADFRNYLKSSRLITDYSERGDGDRPQGPFMPVTPAKDGTGRALGAPYDAALLQFLIQRLRMTEAAALEYPLGLAQAHYLAYLEREGGLRILNGDEMEFEDYCRAEDAKAAAAKATNPPIHQSTNPA